ncbi:transcriptional regulator RcsB [Yersinia mollaretii]|uniref:response regulator transcription factor n=1 Tax=Yersinia mollaretii TaxID=33060 RepID=UPI0005DF76D1|nr:response regulator transcription factor [Yersinia mollaretii]CNK99825.1 transcriptional regulator RcsB [Yersinia mollaretii]
MLNTDVRVIIADDHPIVQLGVAKILEAESDIQVVGVAGTVEDLLKMLKITHCDVLVCDYAFRKDPEPDGMALLQKIRRYYPAINIILLTSYDSVVIVREVLQIGVRAFVSKSSQDLDHLADIVRRVIKGEQCVDHKTSQELISYMLEAPSSGKTGMLMLSPREMEVVRLFSDGMTVTEIAQYTRRSLKTISTQKKSAMDKLGVKSDSELTGIYLNLAVR